VLVEYAERSVAFDVGTKFGVAEEIFAVRLERPNYLE
jgi:hypothetical protein